MTTDKPYLSPSQLGTYCKCPEAYRRRYIEKEVIPPGMALIRGTGVHSGAKINFAQKVESHQDLPVKEIVEASVAGAEEELHQNDCTLTTEEKSRGKKAVIGETIDTVVRMAELHGKQQAPEYQPVLVEERVRINLPGHFDLLGYLDIVDDNCRVTDFKTAKRKKPDNEVHESVQLTAYASFHQARFGALPDTVRLDTVVATKTKVYRQLQESERGTPDFKALAARIDEVSRAINAGIFPPAMPGSWQCSDDWCGYFRTCPYVNAERQLVQLDA